MQNIFTLFGEIAIRNDEAIRALDETSQQANETSSETESAFQKIGWAALTIGKAVVGAGVALGGAWIAAIEGSREYRTEMGKLNTAFMTAGCLLGIPVLIINTLLSVLIKNKVKYCETGPMLETNGAVHSLWSTFEKRQHKRRRCYIKSI